jgi:hypothetical protein
MYTTLKDPFLEAIRECLHKFNQYKTKTVFCDLLMKIYQLPQEYQHHYQEDIHKLFERINELNPSNEILTTYQRERMRRYFNRLLNRKTFPIKQVVKPPREKIISSLTELVTAVGNHTDQKNVQKAVTQVINNHGCTQKGFSDPPNAELFLYDLQHLLGCSPSIDHHKKTGFYHLGLISPVRKLVQRLVHDLCLVSKEGNKAITRAVENYLNQTKNLDQRPELKVELETIQKVLVFYGWTVRGFLYLDDISQLINDLKVILELSI